MSKKALAIRTADTVLQSGISGYFTAEQYATAIAGTPLKSLLENPTFLLDRAVCETDTDYLQLIPYVVLRTSFNGETYYGSYCRGQAGGEAGLRSKYSVGFGGHVDTQPPQGLSLIEHLSAECARELKEELGQIHSLLRLAEQIREANFIYIKDTPVDEVHLGLIVVVDMSPSVVLTSPEAGVIDDLKWRKLSDLREMAREGRMETWSRIILTCAKATAFNQTYTMPDPVVNIKRALTDLKRLRYQMSSAESYAGEPAGALKETMNNWCDGPRKAS